MDVCRCKERRGQADVYISVFHATTLSKTGSRNSKNGALIHTSTCIPCNSCPSVQWKEFFNQFNDKAHRCVILPLVKRGKSSDMYERRYGPLLSKMPHLLLRPVANHWSLYISGFFESVIWHEAIATSTPLVLDSSSTHFHNSEGKLADAHAATAFWVDEDLTFD